MEGRIVPAIFHIGPIGWTSPRGGRSDSALTSTGEIFGDDSSSVSYVPIQLQRGRTQDTFFEEWARAVSDDDSDAQPVRSIRIQLLNEAGQLVMAFILHGCTPVEYVALGPLDANVTGIAVETLTLNYQSFERDRSIVEPVEPDRD